MKIFLFITFSLIGILSPAQTTDFKSETDAIISSFEKTITILGDTTASADEIKSAQKEIRNTIVSINTSLPYHFAGIDTLSNVKKVLFSLQENFPHGYDFKMNHEKMIYEDIHIDKERNCYRIKATLKSRFIAPVITTTSIDTFRVDSLVNADSTITTDTITYTFSLSDTTQAKHFAEMTFYLTTKKMFGEFEPLKIDAISLSKEEPVFTEELSELTKWWIDLSPLWQEKISKELNFPEAPTDYFLKWVQGMKKIDLTGFTKKDIYVLSQFKGIQELNLSNMELDTLDFLRGMTGLQILHLTNNKLKSIAGIETLPNLEYLNFSGNEVIDITPVGSCTNLMTLLFNENQVERIDAVQNLPRLLTLKFENNKVIDIKALKGCRGIKDLNIAKNKDIESLDPISHLVTMQRLNCYNTNVSSLTPLRGMTGIYDLDIGYTKITSLDELRFLTNISKLNISGNIIDDFSALNKLDRLTKFYCSATKITDISPFLSLKHLTVFTAPNTSFTKTDIQRLKKKFPKCAITYY